MHLLTGLVICTFVVQRSSCYLDLEDWDNNFDEKLDFKCPFRNQFISTVVSVHHNGAEDRRFKLNCRNIISGGRGDQDASCEDSGLQRSATNYLDSFQHLSQTYMHCTQLKLVIGVQFCITR